MIAALFLFLLYLAFTVARTMTQKPAPAPPADIEAAVKQPKVRGVLGTPTT